MEGVVSLTNMDHVGKEKEIVMVMMSVRVDSGVDITIVLQGSQVTLTVAPAKVKFLKWD